MLDERTDEVRKYVYGDLIDMGCGENLLVKKRGDGIGVDVYDFGGADLIVDDSANLPFLDGTFDTATLIATLNHIPEEKRLATLKELYRVLNDDGACIITCLPPVTGFFRHNTAWWDRDYHERLFSHGESHGLSKEYIVSLMESAGFHLLFMDKFILGLNRIYVFEK